MFEATPYLHLYRMQSRLMLSSIGKYGNWPFKSCTISSSLLYETVNQSCPDSSLINLHTYPELCDLPACIPSRVTTNCSVLQYLFCPYGASLLLTVSNYAERVDTQRNEHQPCRPHPSGSELAPEMLNEHLQCCMNYLLHKRTPCVFIPDTWVPAGFMKCRADSNSWRMCIWGWTDFPNPHKPQKCACRLCTISLPSFVPSFLPPSQWMLMRLFRVKYTVDYSIFFKLRLHVAYLLACFNINQRGLWHVLKCNYICPV